MHHAKTGDYIFTLVLSIQKSCVVCIMQDIRWLNINLMNHIDLSDCNQKLENNGWIFAVGSSKKVSKFNPFDAVL